MRGIHARVNEGNSCSCRSNFLPLHFCWFVLYVEERSLVKQRKIFFISLRKLFHSWDSQILTFQIFKWRHQMPKHETRNTYYWITWEVNTVWYYYYTSNISSLLQKFHFPIEVLLNYFQTQRSLELVFRSQFLQNLFDEFFFFCNMT